MRIRKNAKPSAFDSNHNHQPAICLLNQSPWDIITFPSTHSSSSSIHLFDDFVTRYNVNVAANWSSPDSATPIQSVADSTKKSFESEHDIVDEKIVNYESCRKEDELGFMKGCVKKEDLQNDAVWTTQAQPGSKSRGSKKRAVVNISKQNEFYYYSGFGPTWGKKRGGLGNKCTTFNACDTTSSITSSVYETSGGGGDMDLEEDHIDKRVEADTTRVSTVWSCRAAPRKEDFDCVERDGDKQKEKTVKKRGRKPIKARSLKSLM